MPLALHGPHSASCPSPEPSLAPGSVSAQASPAPQDVRGRLGRGNAQEGLGAHPGGADLRSIWGLRLWEPQGHPQDVWGSQVVARAQALARASLCHGWPWVTGQDVSLGGVGEAGQRVPVWEGLTAPGRPPVTKLAFYSAFPAGSQTRQSQAWRPPQQAWTAPELWQVVWRCHRHQAASGAGPRGQDGLPGGARPVLEAASALQVWLREQD